MFCWKNRQTSKKTQELLQWKDMNLKPQIMKGLQEVGFQSPSQVQSRAIPILLKDKDIICQAKSGRGKTAVFVISLIQLILGDYFKNTNSFQCMVIAHTRELALQIEGQFKRLSKYCRNPSLKTVLCIGGTSMQDNVNKIKKLGQVPHVLIGTPGRLLDLIIRVNIDCRDCRYLVIDQCDHALNQNQSLTRQILGIIDFLPQQKQVMMFSATIGESFAEEWCRLMKNPEKIIMQQDDISDNLHQFKLVLKERQKQKFLIQLLDYQTFNQIVIFVNKIERAISLTNFLTQNLFDPVCIHSGLTQFQRIQRYKEFKNNRTRLMVSTNLFGRGIDIEKVDFVINFDFPFNKQEYLHRVGRAGRFGSKGMAVSFVKGEEGSDMKILAEVLNCYKFKIEQYKFCSRKQDITIYG